MTDESSDTMKQIEKLSNENSQLKRELNSYVTYGITYNRNMLPVSDDGGINHSLRCFGAEDGESVFELLERLKNERDEALRDASARERTPEPRESLETAIDVLGAISVQIHEKFNKLECVEGYLEAYRSAVEDLIVARAEALSNINGFREFLGESFAAIEAGIKAPI